MKKPMTLRQAMAIIQKQNTQLAEFRAMGKLYPGLREIKKGESGSLFMQVHAGTATSGKKKYSLGTCIGTAALIIHSEQTGRNFRFPMECAITLAQKAGIDGRKEIPNPMNERKAKK